MSFDVISLLEWTGLACAVLCTLGFWCILAGSRKARRAFRGKGYLRPPTGKAWIRFLYYKHYESFEDPGIRFYYRLARICMFLLIFIVIAVAIFVGSILILTRVATTTTLQGQ